MKHLSLVILLFSLTLTSCGDEVPEQRQKSSSGAVSPTLKQLQNLEYESEILDGTPVLLQNGQWDNPDERVSVHMSEIIATGDLNADGNDDAAVVFAVSTGGSGLFHELMIVINEDGSLENVASIQLGDRVELQGMEIDSGELQLTMIKHAEEDPMCCPTLNVLKTFELDDDELEEVGEEVLGRSGE